VAAANEVSGAIERVDAELGPIDSLGLFDVDFASMTKLAVDDVARLDTGAARAEVAHIDAVLHGATTTGLLRLGAALGALALVLGLVFVLRRRRRPAAVVSAPSAPVIDGVFTVVEQPAVEIV